MQSRGMKSWLLIVTIALCCSAATAAPPGTIKGQIVDSEGAVIKGAHLLFHSDPSGQNKAVRHLDMTGETDAEGHFHVQLEPGFYDVCVMATAFTPECRKVLIANGETV